MWGFREGVRDVVGRRLSRLSEEVNDLLGVAAVIGLEFELAILRTAAGLTEDALVAAIDEAAAARLVVDVAGSGLRCRFAHALVRDTLYAEFSAARRVALHRRVAEAIETVHGANLAGHLPALAYHYGRAAAPAAETLKAVNYAAQAGDEALAQLAHDEAAGYYAQALEMLAAVDGPVDQGQRQELLIRLGEAKRRAGDPTHRETLLEAADLARRRGDAQALARAALANTRGLLPTAFGRVDQEKVAVLETAIAAAGESDGRARAALLAILGVELIFSGDWRRCLELSNEAVDLARSTGDLETLARVLVARYFPTCAPGLLDERLGDTAELLEIADALSDPAFVAEAHLLRGRAAVEAGEMAEADRCFDVAERLAVALGQPALRWRVTYIRACRALIAGRLADAERLLLESRDWGDQAGQLDAVWVFAAEMWGLRFQQGRLDPETLRLLEAAQRKVDVPWNQSVNALTACEFGRDDEARAALDRSASTPVPFDIYWLSAMTPLGRSGCAPRCDRACGAAGRRVAAVRGAGDSLRGGADAVGCASPRHADHRPAALRGGGRPFRRRPGDPRTDWRPALGGPDESRMGAHAVVTTPTRRPGTGRLAAARRTERLPLPRCRRLGRAGRGGVTEPAPTRRPACRGA
jgi:hypothetical protein